jgi:hypothetical protein
MNALNFCRYTLVSGVAVAIFAGCGGNRGILQSIPEGSTRETTLHPANRSAFSGTYSGNYIFKICGGGSGGYFKFKGSGKVSFLGQAWESGKVQEPLAMPYPHCAQPWKGGDWLTSKKDPNDRVHVALNGPSGSGSSPCNGQFAYSVTGGTGKFAKATGSGTVTFQCSSKSFGKYSDTWTGTLKP